MAAIGRDGNGGEGPHGAEISMAIRTVEYKEAASPAKVACPGRINISDCQIMPCEEFRQAAGLQLFELLVARQGGQTLQAEQPEEAVGGRKLSRFAAIGWAVDSH